MKIRDVLAGKGSRVQTIWPVKTLAHAVRVFDERKIASAVVTDASNTPRGIITDRALIHGIALHGKDALDMPVTNFMISPAPVCTPDDTVNAVMRTMTEKRIRHILVMDEEQMAGVVSIGDLVKVRLDDAAIEGKVLREMALGQLAAE